MERLEPNLLDWTPGTLNSLCARAGVGEYRDAQALPGGRNNRVYCLRAGGDTFLLKVYFRHHDDARNRLKREFKFLQYAWSLGVTAVPRPVYADDARQIGLYEFVHGRRLGVDEIQESHIEEAIAFYHRINEGRTGARGISDASEACFSIAGHIDRVDQRMERLTRIEPFDASASEARRFISEVLMPVWAKAREKIAAAYECDGMVHTTLVQSARRLSPSDFGYHNALLEDSGRLRFLDFEYAGWDDPAKLACDFANQPDMLLPEALSARFEDAVVAGDLFPDMLRRRILWLRPLYQVKWSCIILNCFLPAGRDRTAFATGDDEDVDGQLQQLEKSRRMLERAVLSLERACQSSWAAC